MSRAEKLIIFQTVVLIAFASWAFGGMISWAPPWILGICASAVIPLFVHCRERWMLRIEKPSLVEIARTIPWPWILFFLLGIVSIINVGYEPVPQEQGGGYTTIDYVAWLPSAVAADKAAEKLQLLAAFLFQASVLYHILQSRKAIRGLIILIYCNSLIFAIFGTVQKLLGISQIYGKVTPPRDSFFAGIVYHNHWAAFALLSLGLGAGLFFHYQKKYAGFGLRGSPAPLILVSLLLIALTIPFSISRSGTLLLTLFIVIFAAKALRLTVAKQNLRAAARKLSLIGGTAALVLIGAVVYSVVKPGLDSQIERTDRQVTNLLEDGRWEVRYYANRDTWTMFRAEPVWGWGAGNFSTVFPLFQGEEIQRSSGGFSFYEHAHNDWLEYLSEFGLAGFLLLLSVPTWILARLLWIRGLTTLGAWPLIGCGLIGLHAIMDFPFGNHAVFLLFAVAFALATKDCQMRKSTRSSRAGAEGNASSLHRTAKREVQSGSPSSTFMLK